MTKFKTGDSVSAHEDAPYRITRNGWTGTVLATRRSTEKNGHKDIKVKENSGEKEYEGWVDSTYFDLVPRKYQIGDWVIGNSRKDNPYGITNKGWIGEITDIRNGEIYVAARRGSEGTSYWVNPEYFDPYVPEATPKTSGSSATSEILSKKGTITNAEAYKLLFGIPHKKESCLTSRCADCPLSESNGGSCGNTETEWWQKPYTGAFTLIDPDRLPLPDTSKRKSDYKDYICREYNKSDLDCLNYIKDNDLWCNAEQYAKLDYLLLLNELIFTHNSETYSETAYRIKFYSFLAEFGIGIDEKGYAFVRK